MIYLMKNKILNIIIAIVATLILILINATDITLIRIIVKSIVLLILIVSLYHMRKYKQLHELKLNNNLFILIVVLSVTGTFILNPKSNNIIGKWIYKEERVLDGIYKMEIMEDSTFVYRVFSKKTDGRVLHEGPVGRIKEIKNGKGIAKESFLIQFNWPSASNKEIIQKYLVYNEYDLVPPPVDLDYGDYDYFPFTPVNDFEGKWVRE